MQLATPKALMSSGSELDARWALPSFLWELPLWELPLWELLQQRSNLPVDRELQLGYSEPNRIPERIITHSLTKLGSDWIHNNIARHFQ